MGRPPHAGRFSISRRTSRKVALLLLQQTAGFALGCGRGVVAQTEIRQKLQKPGCEEERTPHSRQLLQGTLLVDLIGAVGDVGMEMSLGVLFQDVTDVLHTHLCLVPLFQVLEEPVQGERGRE